MFFSNAIVVKASSIEKEMKLQYDIDIEDAAWTLFDDEYSNNSCMWLNIGPDVDGELEELQVDATVQGSTKALHKIMIINHLRDIFPNVEQILVDVNW